MRLAGEMPAGSTGHGASTPLVRGAIEVTPDGGLIVMGPDHPTTGGYPVVAVVARASQGALAQRRPGATVRFTRA
jgi:allophanate hydrolase subunit 2